MKSSIALRSCAIATSYCVMTAPRSGFSFINKEEWCQNEFQVTSQVKQFNAEQNTRKTRFDVTLLINGLPLVQIELKRRGLGLKGPSTRSIVTIGMRSG
jgi:type I site-specific restriction-modification system R (restriction) subunit